MNISFTWSNMVLFWGHDLVIRKKWAQLWSHSIMTRPTHCGHSFSCIISSLLFKNNWKKYARCHISNIFFKYWLYQIIYLVLCTYLVCIYSQYLQSLCTRTEHYMHCTFKRSWWHSHQSQLIIFEFN